jgi:O-antigen/teichoic acid export membrane protein
MSVNKTRMAINLKSVYSRSVAFLVSDRNLTRKATLNAIAAALDYFARLVVGFLITPILVSGLGDYYFGVWQILLRLIGYITPASGRPTQALKFTLANQQVTTNSEQKRRNVGSTLVVWFFFLPIMTVLGAILAWFIPTWIHAPVLYTWPIRLAAWILVFNLVLVNLAAIPQSIMEGENLGYKRMGVSASLVLLGGIFTWIALYLHTGITGVAIAALAITVVTGIFWLVVGRTYISWFGIARPSRNEAVDFLKLSWWFMGWNLIMILMTASDVVLLGMLDSVQSVTDYSLTKYAPETLISLVAIMVFGIAPGLGGIIGSGEKKKAGSVRGEIMVITWLILTVIGATVLLWNEEFLKLWVGEKYYLGAIPNLFIIMVITQFVLIRNDSNFIDLTLRLRKKVILGGVSVTISLLLAAAFIGYLGLGVIGLCLGLMAGRLILSIGYPLLVGKFLGESLKDQLVRSIRPATVMAAFFIGMTAAVLSGLTGNLAPTFGWPGLIFFGTITFFVILVLAFFTGLTKVQRSRILSRVRIILEGSSARGPDY